MAIGEDPQAQTSSLAELQRESQQLRDGYVSLSHQLIGLRVVQHVTQDLVSDLDVDRLLEHILRSAIAAVDGAAGALLCWIRLERN